MRVLYISNTVSNNLLDYLHQTSTIKPLYSVQKFNKLIINGLASNGIEITALSAIPINPSNHSQKVWNKSPENEGNVKYKYIPFLNIPILRQLQLFLYTFFYCLLWGLKHHKDGRIICDALNISINLASIFTKKLTNIKIAGIITDIPGLLVGFNNKSTVRQFITKINKSYLNSFDYYILLTEQMNSIINKHQRPYIVMEGLVDINMQTKEIPFKKKTRTIMYAGTLHRQYGIKMLLDAFIQIKNPNIELKIFGSGDMEKEIPLYQKQDHRITYWGVIPNENIITEELHAMLLINPRPTHEEFTKYSFPSKNMEYMVSGTPLLTTKLPGMPIEYYNYVYLIEEETIEGCKTAIERILALSDNELRQKGELAKEFVLSKKNNIFQSNRIIQLIFQ